MILLALDTSEKSQGLALIEEGRILGERESQGPISHSEELLINLQDLLRDVSLPFDRVGGIAVTVGPGSFTGLRIGVSTVKALALRRKLPVFPVGTLLALAWPFLADHPWVAPCLDARMGQVYGAVYAGAGGAWRETHPPAPMELYEFSYKINKLAGKGIAVGSGIQAHPDLLHGIKTAPEAKVRAASVAELGWKLYQAGQAVSARDLRPAYLRLSAAELKALGKGEGFR